MNILSIDTSSIIASVSILKGKEVVTMQDTNNITHSERLLKLIDNALVSSGLKLNSLDYLMTTNGPGSFTGSRIGVVTAKGLATPNNLKIIAATSIETMALKEYICLNTKDEKIICVMMDAKNDRAYYGLFRFYTLDNGKIAYAPLLDISNDTISSILYKFNNFQNIVICGDLGEKILESYDTTHLVICKRVLKPNSSYLIDFYNKVSEDILNSHIQDVYSLDVTYARMSQAERIKNGEKV